MGRTNPDRDREPESGWPNQGLPIGRIDTELGDGNDNELWSRRLPDIAKGSYHGDLAPVSWIPTGTAARIRQAGTSDTKMAS